MKTCITSVLSIVGDMQWVSLECVWKYTLLCELCR